jgi:ERCC4-type nuclease
MIIDFREKALIERVPDAQVQNLVLGDIVIQKDGAEFIIERKTGADLSASICDGRYRDQSERLAASGLPPRNVIYVIEGSLDGHSVPRTTLMSVLISLGHRLGFTVMRTECIDETVEYLRTLEQKVDGPATTSVKRAKKDSITVDNIAALMLSQIPSVSMATADAVLQGRTIAELTTALIADPTSLDTVVIKKRHIPKNTIKSIKTFLKV